MDKKNVNRFLLKLAVFIMIVLALMGVFHYYCELKQVVVTGSTVYTDDEIWNMTNKSPLDLYAPFFAVTIAKDKGKNIPFIEKITAKLVASDTVELTVYEKKIIGCVYVMGGYFYFDRDGLVNEYSTRKVDGVPLIEGLDFSSIVLGSKLQVQKERYYKTILNLFLLVEDSELEVDIIRFLRDDAVELEIGETTVRAGEHDTYDVLINAVPSVLEALEDKNIILCMENYSENNTTVVGKPKK